MTVTNTTYAVADITELKALTGLPASASGLYYARYIDKLGWYRFDPDAVSGGIAPDVGSGRWFPLGRETLGANRTYYVRTDGNDNNTGLANTSGGAFLTIQRFFDVLATIDKNGFNVTCKIADGTYTITSGIIVKDGVGSGDIIIEGNTTTPANVVITSSQSAISYFDKNDSSFLYLKGFKLVSTVSPASILIAFINCKQGNIAISDLDFGNASNGIHIGASANGVVYLLGNYTISGNAAIHYAVLAGGYIRDWIAINPSGSTITITITGTPSFAAAFAFARGSGSMIDIFWQRITFSGSATGQQYNAIANSVIATFGGGANYFPGNVSGTTDGFGAYIA